MRKQYRERKKKDKEKRQKEDEKRKKKRKLCAIDVNPVSTPILSVYRLLINSSS